MDFQRLILSVVFFGSLFLLYQAWEKEHAPKPPLASSTVPNVSGSVPGVANSAPTAAVPAATASAAAPLKTERVTIATDYVIAEIDGQGGTITRLELIPHRDLHDLGKNFALLEQTPERTYIAQSGLAGGNLPNHKTAYAFVPGPRELAPGADQLEVRLQAEPAGGVKVDKVFVFHRASYIVDQRFEITNQGSAALSPVAYFQFTRDGKPSEGQQRFVSTFTGPAFYTEADRYNAFDFADIDKGKTKLPLKTDDGWALKTSNGWIAVAQHYFVSAWLPATLGKDQPPYEFYTEKVSDNLYRVGVKVPMAAIPPGGKASLDVPMYSGPEEQDNLEKIAPGLQLVVDYGWLQIIAQPLYWVLEWLHKWVSNWGIAIILLTCMVKAIFYPLNAASYKSMARMRVVAPKLNKLKEQYGDDRVKMNQAMMELYKTEKINPLGGCLPIVVQIPVFIALYRILLASVEMRGAPFYLWIHDLSSPDPYYVLPIVMTVTSYIQMLLNPTPTDPAQAMVMKIMPLVFGVMFFFFPAGLVLYWVVNNLLSIAQQWQITRMIERGKEHAKR
jgi:YidC/Oxa1 family membrane protein insertase